MRTWAEYKESALLWGSFTVYGTEGMRAGRRGLLREAIASRKGVEPDYNDSGGRDPGKPIHWSPSELLVLPVGQTQLEDKEPGSLLLSSYSLVS